MIAMAKAGSLRSLGGTQNTRCDDTRAVATAGGDEAAALL
jgi:hypothetical protein